MKRYYLFFHLYVHRTLSGAGIVKEAENKNKCVPILFFLLCSSETNLLILQYYKIFFTGIFTKHSFLLNQTWTLHEQNKRKKILSPTGYEYMKY